MRYIYIYIVYNFFVYKFSSYNKNIVTHVDIVLKLCTCTTVGFRKSSFMTFLNNLLPKLMITDALKVFL